MKNTIKEEQAIAILAEGKSMGLSIDTEDLCSWGGYIAEEEERYDPDRPWTHICLGVSENEDIEPFKALLAKHGVELDLEDEEMPNVTEQEEYDRVVQDYGCDGPYWYTDEDGNGLDIAFLRDKREAVWSRRAEQIAQYKVEITDIKDGFMPLYHVMKICVNGEPYATADAKVYDVGSEYGLNGGRVSKLGVHVEYPCTRIVKKWLAHYDRDWDTEPATDKDKAVVLAILKMFDK